MDLTLGSSCPRAWCREACGVYSADWNAWGSVAAIKLSFTVGLVSWRMGIVVVGAQEASTAPRVLIWTCTPTF